MSQSEALESVQCLRARPEDPTAVFAADKLGILTTGARYGYFGNSSSGLMETKNGFANMFNSRGALACLRAPLGLNEREYAYC